MPLSPAFVSPADALPALASAVAGAKGGMTESSISLDLVHPDSPSALTQLPQRIAFSSPDGGEDDKAISLHLQEYPLPPGIRMVS